MKGLFSFGGIVSDKIISWGNIITFLIIVSSLLFILLKFGVLPPYIPIFNQLPWGEDRLASRIMIFVPVFAVFATAMINIFISASIYGKSQLISRMLTVSSILIAFLSFLFVIRTIQLIT